MWLADILTDYGNQLAFVYWQISEYIDNHKEDTDPEVVEKVANGTSQVDLIKEAGGRCNVLATKVMEYLEPLLPKDETNSGWEVQDISEESLHPVSEDAEAVLSEQGEDSLSKDVQ